MSSMMTVLYLLLLALNLADGITTWIFVHPRHYDREANPLARWMFRCLGITLGIIVAELLWMGVISLLYFTLFQTYPTLGIILLSVGVAVWSYIIPGNIRYCLKCTRQKR